MARNKEFDENEVLRKAMELFWIQGYEKTSMQDLVKNMGIHRRSLYDTFGDKHTLFIKALEHYNETIRSRTENKVNQLESVKEAIRQLFEMVIVRDKQQIIGCLTVNTAVELSLHDDQAAEKVLESFSETELLLNKLVLRGQQSGEISNHLDAKKTSEFLHNSLVGLRVMTKTTDDIDKLNNVIDITLSVLD
ncbi:MULTISPECIES: TetR/AcrR family transcriptional regulator [Terribacillus]|jgi:TetR/AcrR family transcriptional regulator, transcriptional repressor for nem operon|uniref:TetR family transcriptional regulator n=1 Tax=Terribacillus saccharophilus TaxID=361277 RepID=A0ABX4H2P6_9BACI|nr:MULTISPECIES: TetR/AcrR family transcriptional regulator [Terribacillus]PAD37129.1 TetR family transcriptional regulator [Terribacillus saccharophilus]PAD97373.1 TetR family transcriptional regulator [Terribacillus saccharophilus]PAE01421.1 TetR family transcriptional regulator [Terribacillus saccharophilus]